LGKKKINHEKQNAHPPPPANNLLSRLRKKWKVREWNRAPRQQSRLLVAISQPAYHQKNSGEGGGNPQSRGEGARSVKEGLLFRNEGGIFLKGSPAAAEASRILPAFLANASAAILRKGGRRGRLWRKRLHGKDVFCRRGQESFRAEALLKNNSHLDGGFLRI